MACKSELVPAGCFAILMVMPVSVCFAQTNIARSSPIKGTAADWPCFRGPNRAGVSGDPGLPTEWNDTKNLVWKTALPGAGASSPITIGDRIYVSCYSGYGLSRESPGNDKDLRHHLVCLDRSRGKILWDASSPNRVPDHPYGDFVNLHGFASSTPVADDTGVYAYFGTTGLRAYTHDGALRWERSCGQRYTNFGSAASPVLYSDLVIVNASVESDALIAFDKTSGREKWRLPTKGLSRSTPLVLDTASAPELIFHLGESYKDGAPVPSGLAALDPRNGTKLWECISLDSYLNPSPIFHEGVVFAIGCYPNRAVAVRAGGRGDVTQSHKIWDIRHGSEVSTPVYYDGHLYWANEESGIAYCVNAVNGEVVYQERLEPRPGRIYASGVIADGKLFYVSRESGAFVLAAKPRYELLAHNTIESDRSVFNATPSISRGDLLLRSDQYLYCIGNR